MMGFTMSFKVHGTFNFGVYKNVRLSNMNGSHIYLTVVFSDVCPENILGERALEQWSRLRVQDPTEKGLSWDVVFGNELCGILKEDAESIKAISGPFSFDSNKALGELHSHLFCPICIEDYQGQETITKTSCCDNAFHESCLKEHMETTEHAKCPMCRTTLKKPDVPCKRSGAEKEEQLPPLSKMDEV
jgi:hypothetical protein